MLCDVKKHLAEFLDLPEELLPEFVDSFLESFDMSAQNLRPYAEGAAPDWLNIRQITHTIKGFAGGAGAEDLLALSNRLNAAAHAEDAEACRIGAQAILDLHARYRADA